MSKSNTASAVSPISQEGANEYRLSDVAAAILPLSQALESEKSAVDRKPAPAHEAAKDHISTLTLELDQAFAIADLLFMLASDSDVESLHEDTLTNSLHTLLMRLEAAKEAAVALIKGAVIVGATPEPAAA